MRRGGWWLAAALVAGLHLLGFGGASYDDNFITYRYAEQWAVRGELEYNPGERVLGTSAPGYAVALGTVARLFPDPRAAIPHLASLAFVLSLLAVAAVVRRRLPATEDDVASGWRAAGVLLLLAFWLCNRLSLLLAGSETFVVVALVVVAADRLLATRPWPWLAGGLVAAAMVVRLDGGLGAAALGLVAWARRRRLPWRYALAGILPTAAWLLWLESQFGRVVPFTLAGKTALGEVAYGAHQWRWLVQSLGAPLAWALALAAVSGAAFLLRAGWWRLPVVQALALFLAAIEVAYRLAGVWFAPWYHVGLFLALGGLAFVGVSPAALARLPGLRRGRAGRWIGAMAWLALVAATVPAAVRGWGEPVDPRHALYRQAAEVIAAAAPAPDERVLAAEIGVLGYTLDQPILDYGALVSPQFAAAKFDGTRDELALRLRPEWVVLAPGGLMAGLRGALADDYVTVATLPVTGHPGRAVRVLRRRR